MITVATQLHALRCRQKDPRLERFFALSVLRSQRLHAGIIIVLESELVTAACCTTWRNRTLDLKVTSCDLASVLSSCLVTQPAPALSEVNVIAVHESHAVVTPVVTGMKEDIASSLLSILQKGRVETQEQASLRSLLRGLDFCRLVRAL